jgi:hypothetical protein
MQSTFGNRVAPTTEEILQAVPRINPDYQGSSQHEMVGGLVAPALAKMLKMGAEASKGLKGGLSIEDVSKSPFVPNVNAGEEMFVMHNLTPKKLANAEKLGGMPIPSLGISKVSSPLNDFGDITLIGSKEMAIPSKINPAFKSDAYTKRAPEIDYQIDYKSKDKLENLFSDVKDKVYDGKYDIFHLTDDFGRRSDNALLQAKFLNEKGLLPDISTYQEPYKQKKDIRELIQKNQSDYDSWLEHFDKNLPNEGINVKEKIFKGYTPSGNRKYVDANLENTVKEMKGGASTEGWSYGVGNIRALITPKFKNLEEIKSSRNRIINPEEFNKIKDVTNKNYENILNKLRELNKDYDANDAITEVAQTKNINLLNSIYKNIPSDLKQEINSFLTDLKKMPTEYFEIKPQRAVNIKEFKGAIVPKDLSSKTMSILEKNGIKEIYQYGTKQERQELVKKFGKEMFAGLPALEVSRRELLEKQFDKK